MLWQKLRGIYKLSKFEYIKEFDAITVLWIKLCEKCNGEPFFYKTHKHWIDTFTIYFGTTAFSWLLPHFINNIILPKAV